MKKKEIKILDGLWSDKIKDRAGYKCEHCGIRGVRMEAAHVVGRRHRATRWGYAGSFSGYDLCGHCFCHNCHQQYDEHGPLEHDISHRTVGLARKMIIQGEASKLVSQSQDFNEIKETLERM